MEETHSAQTATQQAAVLQTAGEREAAVLATAGLRDEKSLKAAGDREAAILATAGHRQINVIWETTQMRVALSVIWGSLVVAVVFLFGVANLVTGFYFGRTNHARTGGVGGDSVREDR